MPTNIDSKLIAKKFAVHGYNIHPAAIELLKKVANSQNLDFIISYVCKVANSFIITEEDIISA